MNKGMKRQDEIRIECDRKCSKSLDRNDEDMLTSELMFEQMRKTKKIIDFALFTLCSLIKTSFYFTFFMFLIIIWRSKYLHVSQI